MSYIDPTHRLKKMEVGAFQMTKARRSDNSDWPEWLHKAWNGDRDKAGTVQVAKIAGRIEVVTYRDETLTRVTLVHWDDWIVQLSDKSLRVLDPRAFTDMFEDWTDTRTGQYG